MQKEVEFYIWGAGFAAKEFLYALNVITEENKQWNYVCKGVIDSNEKRWNTEFIGYRIIAPELAYKEKSVLIIIPLVCKTEKILRKKLLDKGYVYGETLWKASDFLARYMKDSIEELNNKETAYRHIVKKLFNHKISVENRCYLYAHILLDYLKVLLENKADVSDVVDYAKQIIWDTTEDEFLADFFRYNRGLFRDSSLTEKGKHLWNNNIQVLKKIVSEKYLENLSSKADYFRLDESFYLIISKNSMYFAENLLSLDTSLFFYELDKLENNGRLCFVLNHIKQLAVDEIVKRAITSDAESLAVCAEEIYNLMPETEMYEYLMAQKCFIESNYEMAQKYAEQGLIKRQFSEKLCMLEGDILFQQKKYLDAIRYYARTMLKNATREQMWMILSNGELNADEVVNTRIKKCIECYAIDDEIKIQQCADVLYSELVVNRAKFKDKKIIYHEGKFKVLDVLKQKPTYEVRDYDKKFFLGQQKNSVSEYFESELYKDYKIVTEGKTFLLPIQRLHNAAIDIKYKGHEISYEAKCGSDMIIGRTVDRFPEDEWVKIRITDDIYIHSNESFIVGTPIEIGGDEENPKLIVNLFIDALAFSHVKDKMDEYMPYTKSFFEKGVIFNECYAVGEWTQTSYPSMFMGLEPKKLECFQPRYQFKMPESEKSLPERLKEKGYYNTLITADPSERFIVMGPERGYDHSVEKIRMDLSESIREMIKIIKECNRPLFLNLHTLDIHDSHFQMGNLATKELSVGEHEFEDILRSDAYCGDQNIHLDNAYQKREIIYLKLLKQIDFELNYLYYFLENTFANEEILVCLHADHGGFGGEFPLSKEHTNIPMMFRGYGIDKIGATSEVVSGMDLYAMYGKICEFNVEGKDAVLPKVFGGNGRDYAITHWRYPNQRYRMAINDERYECLVESRIDVTGEGKISENEYWMHLIDKINQIKVKEPKQLDYFISIVNQEIKYFTGQE